MSIKIAKINTIFCGSSDFGLPALEALIKDDFFNVTAVITQPDKQAGRGHGLNMLPIKKAALRYKIPLLQPADISLAKNKIKSQRPDIAVVIAYAQLIPEAILKIPAHGFINVHASLLPNYRGAAPMRAAILNNNNKTGITVIKITSKLDAGPIIAQAEIGLEPDETAIALAEKLSVLSARILPTALKKYISGDISLRPQDNNKASYAKKITKADGFIDFKQSARTIERFIRAMNPWPGAFTNTDQPAGVQNKDGSTARKQLNIRLIKTENQPVKINSHKPGQFFLYHGKLAIQCSPDALLIEKLQPSNKNIMAANDFINGYGKYIKR